MPDLDLNRLFEDPAYSIEVRTEDREALGVRLRGEEADAQFRRWRDRWLFIVGVGVALVVGGFCLWASLDQGFSAEQQRWASSIVTSMIGGIVGYLTGRASK